MESTGAADSARRDLYLLVDGMNADAIWSLVDQEHDAGRHVWLAGELVEPFARRFGQQRDGRNWILVARKTTQPDWAYRVRDILVAAIALILLAPVFAVLGIMVKRSSPGPIFYMTVVVGRAQKQFVWRKFRSMIAADPDKDQAGRADQFRVFAEGKHKGKLVDASRITPIGSFLRKHSLDELPQLWNVLKGDMALVGPRPCLPYEAELYPAWAQRRFRVRPGLTGVWQVIGRGRVSVEEGLMMDVYYVYSRTLGFDFRLATHTLRVILLGEGGM